MRTTGQVERRTSAALCAVMLGAMGLMSPLMTTRAAAQPLPTIPKARCAELVRLRDGRMVAALDRELALFRKDEVAKKVLPLLKQVRAEALADLRKAQLTSDFTVAIRTLNGVIRYLSLADRTGGVGAAHSAATCLGTFLTRAASDAAASDALAKCVADQVVSDLLSKRAQALKGVTDATVSTLTEFRALAQSRDAERKNARHILKLVAGVEQKIKAYEEVVRRARHARDNIATINRLQLHIAGQCNAR